MSMKGEIIWRIGLVYVLMTVIAGAVIFKTLHVQMWEGEKWRKKSVAVRVKDFEVAPNRGDICACDGRKLASSVPYYELRWDASVVDSKLFGKKVDSLALCLSRFFGDESKAVYKQHLEEARARKKTYYLINRRKVSFNELKKIRTFPIFRKGRNSGGLIEEMNSVRLQPHVNLATRTIGYLNEAEDGSFEGRVGLEGAFENELKGIPGRSMKQMMSGTWVPVTVEEPVDGNDIITTIDIDYQDIVQNALMRQLEKFDADRGTAILMEVETGDVKAIANLKRQPLGGYSEEFNYAIGDAGEPGSVMKAATMIAMLEDGHVEPGDTVDLGGKGEYEFFDKTLTDSDGKKPGKITVQHVFEISSNGIAKLVNDFYKDEPDRFVNRLCGLDLDKRLEIPLKGEGDPYIKHPGDSTWSGISLPWMSIGYEVKLTPLQVLAFYNAIANNGQRMRPRFVKEIRHRGKLVEQFDPEEVGGRICSRSTLKKLQRMLEGVVENGTARKIYTDKYRIAGKTGTARIATGKKGYQVRKYRASFVGYFPADHPLYSCIVVIDEPSLSKGYYASSVSSPVFREIADKVYSIAYRQYGEIKVEADKSLPVCKNGLKEDFLTVFDDLDIGIEGKADVRQNDWVLTASNEGEKVVLKPRRISNSQVPNVKGMGLKDALYLLENAGLSVGVSGAGMVMSQSLQPGTEVRNGSYIHIELR